MLTGTLSLNQGDSFSWNSIASDSAGNVIDLTYLTGAGYLKLNYGNSGVLDQFNFNVTNASSGNYNISLTPLQTSNYPITQGVYGIYVYNGSLNSGTYQAQIAQGYININPELIPNFTGLYFQTTINSGASVPPSPQTYFGASTLIISGSIIYNDGLTGDQGYKTTRVNVLSGTGIYTGTFIESNTNAFIGATLNYIITMPNSSHPTLIFQNTTGNILIQPPISGGQIFVQLGYDGSNWQVNQWA